MRHFQAKTEEFRQRYKDAVAKFGGDPEERISYADTKEGLAIFANLSTRRSTRLWPRPSLFAEKRVPVS